MSSTSSPDEEIVKRLEEPTRFGGILTVGRFIVNRLKECGLATVQLLTVQQMGVHPNNRSSYGINEESVHTLGGDIAELGWDWGKLGGHRLALGGRR